jgi:hypothetical protein
MGTLEAGSGRRCESRKCPVYYYYYYYYYYCSSSIGCACVCDKRLCVPSTTKDAKRLPFEETVIQNKRPLRDIIDALMPPFLVVYII